MPDSTHAVRRIASSRTRRSLIGTPLVAALSIALTLLGACSAGDTSAARTGGTLVISAFADADLLVPPLTMSGQGLQVVDAVFDRLADARIDEHGVGTFAPALASSWSWSADSLAITFALNPAAVWHDGVAVTANDVRFTWAAYVDSALASPAAEGLRNIDSVTVKDAHTAVVWFKRRNVDQLSDAATQMRIMPQHLLDSIPRASWRSAGFARHPIGSGRFRFKTWDAGARIELVTDSANYRGRASLDRVIWTISPDPAAATMRLFAGDADFLESVRPDAAAEFAKHPDVQLLRSPSLAYGFLQFNLERGSGAHTPHPLFSDRAMRRAISMAVNREALIRAVFDTLARVALGPVARAQLAGDSTLTAVALSSLAFDTTAANRTLDSLGWRAASAGGVRTRNGVRLTFTTLVPSSSAQRVRIATLLQDQLKAIGADMSIEKVEFNALNARLAKGDFDAVVMAMGVDPSPSSIRGVWSSSAGRAHGGTNFGNYANAAFDALLDSASMQTTETKAKPFYQRAYAQIIGDAPAVWLFEPWNMSGVRRAVHPVGIRPDGWWTQLGDWTRDAAK